LVKGAWKYLYRTAGKGGKTVDFQLPTKQDKAAVLRLFDKAMKASGVPEKVALDKRGRQQGGHGWYQCRTSLGRELAYWIGS
jgi:transposase-like protein